MRHRNTRSKLGRTSEHRLALMKNLAAALIDKERIHTTAMKAQHLRPFVERLVTLAKDGDLHARRQAFSHVGKKETVHKLFTEIAPRVAQREGGYLRIVKDAPRQGDGALMAYIEFVDAAPKAEGGEKGEATKTVKQRLHERRKELARTRRR